MANHRGLFSHFCLILAACVLFAGCTGPSCEELRTELTDLYNSYIEDITPLTEAEILEKCAQARQACPALAMAYELAGLVHWNNERYQQALPLYAKALSLAPEDTYDFTLADARLLTFEAGRHYFIPTTDGTVQTKPFGTITLDQYRDCSDELRLMWCQFSLDFAPDIDKTQDVVDQQGNVIGTSRTTMTSNITSPHHLDTLILQEARANPGKGLGKAVTDIVMRESVGSIQTDIY